jgi:hypothetical protein
MMIGYDIYGRFNGAFSFASKKHDFDDQIFLLATVLIAVTDKLFALQWFFDF